jgi:hypothetical protein
MKPSKLEFIREPGQLPVSRLRSWVLLLKGSMSGVRLVSGSHTRI